MSTPKGKYISNDAWGDKTACTACQWWTETENRVMRSAHSCARTCKKYQIIFWVCGKYGGENGYRVGDLGADWRVILKGILKIG